MEKQTYEELALTADPGDYDLPPDWEDAENLLPKRKRNTPISLRVTEREHAIIKKCMRDSGIEHWGAFILSLVNSAKIVRFDLENIREVSRLLGNVANNLNQISRRVNETGNLYSADVTDLQEHYNVLISQWGEALGELRRVKEAN
jgi:hypothetical protein